MAANSSLNDDLEFKDEKIIIKLPAEIGCKVMMWTELIQGNFTSSN
jgi:hypothetical protein